MVQKSPEQKKSYQTVKAFKGMNTRPNRTALEDTEFAWLENAQPIGFGNIKIVGTSDIVNVTGGSAVAWAHTVSELCAVNIDNKDYILAFQTDGSAEYYCIDTTTKGTIAAAATFSASGVRAMQWNNDRSIIVDPNNGYFTWDATNLVQVGSIGVVGIEATGSGYTTVPDAYISAPNQTGGVQATLIASINNAAGTITNVQITSGGSGYTAFPTVTIDPPATPYGVQATASVTSIASGAVGSIQITNPGYGYTTAPSITFSSGAAAATAIVGSGQVIGLTVTDAGSGYLPTSFTGSISTTTLTVSAMITGSMVFGQLITGPGVAANTYIQNQLTGTPGGAGTYTATVSQTVGSTTMTASPGIYIAGGGGSGAFAAAAPLSFSVGTVGALVTSGGSGYTSAPSVTFTGGSPTRAATAIAIVFGTQVTEIIVLDPGAGYTSLPTISFSGGSPSTAATAIAVLSDQPISDIASFQGRVWIAQGRTVFYSAANQYQDFVSVSAGNVEMTDDTLHSNISALISANNFLYVFGDDSINVFSDVRVLSSGITTFTNTNVSASTGSIFIDGIFPYFRSLLFINEYGVFALIGATVSKISDALDGIIPLIDYTSPVTGGQVLINNILCAAFNVYYNDPVNGKRPIQLVFFDKKWFVTSQGTLNRVAPVATGHKLYLYGTAGTNLLTLYTDTTAAINSTIKSALWPLEDTIRDKQALKFGVEATLSLSGSVNIYVDSEINTSPVYTFFTTVNWINNSGGIVTWENNSSGIVPWIGGYGYTLFKSDAQQYGKYLGLTITSATPSFTLNTLEMEYELRARF